MATLRISSGAEGGGDTHITILYVVLRHPHPAQEEKGSPAAGGGGMATRMSSKAPQTFSQGTRTYPTNIRSEHVLAPSAGDKNGGEKGGNP